MLQEGGRRGDQAAPHLFSKGLDWLCTADNAGTMNRGEGGRFGVETPAS